LECGGWAPLSFFCFSGIVLRRKKPKKESGVEPPHFKVADRSNLAIIRLALDLPLLVKRLTVLTFLGLAQTGVIANLAVRLILAKDWAGSQFSEVR
jgi:hypothetical protein